MALNPHTDVVTTYLTQLDTIPWFEHLGQPSARDPEVIRINAWARWPGPENCGSEIQQDLYNQWHHYLFNQ